MLVTNHFADAMTSCNVVLAKTDSFCVELRIILVTAIEKVDKMINSMGNTQKDDNKNMQKL